ncbi:MAG: formyltetrahydrofolate deformylase, partial [Pseudomonadota bacterium]|nr:formyltetrahydrofolate deformylase [Pseudomonadota bacterium]
CRDGLGIVAAVSQIFAEAGLNIDESQQYSDAESGMFFMRVGLSTQHELDHPALDKKFAPVAKKFQMNWKIVDAAHRPRALIMVSKFDHCLVDLIYRCQTNSLHMDIVGVISNHKVGQHWSENAGLPFHYRSGGADARAENEAHLLEMIEAEGIELVILARYMQILSPELAAQLFGRMINIHHSFLPSFKGAVPYSRAHERGVKMIGATAHFVTPDLDEGPIISQGVADIRHDMTIDDLIDVGRDVERSVLARALRLFTEHRILLNGPKTVIFD